MYEWIRIFSIFYFQMKTSKTRELYEKMVLLQEKRKEHDRIIENLVSKSSLGTRNSSRINQMSQYNRTNHHRHKRNEIKTLKMSTISNLSSSGIDIDIDMNMNISHEVNLLANLHLQQQAQSEYNSIEKSHKINNKNNKKNKEKNLLKESLLLKSQNFFTNRLSLNSKKIITIKPRSAEINGWLYCCCSEVNVDFELICQFLTKNQLWEQIFVEEEGGYYANLEGRRVCLSECQVRQQEESLIVYVGEEEDQNSCCCIGLLLLYRLLSLLNNGYAPQILQQLFGYPFRTFNIHHTPEYYTFINFLTTTTQSNKNKKTFLLLVQSTISKRLQIIPQNFLDNILTTHNTFLKKFSKAIVVDTRDLCYKRIQIVQKRNHHVVVDLEIGGAQGSGQKQQQQFQQMQEIEREDEYVITLANKEGKGKNLQDQDETFRVCVVDENMKIIYPRNSQTGNLQNHESFTLKLSKDTQYKIYISSQSLSPTPQYTLTIHSSTPIDNLQLSLKFKEQYKNYTQILIDRYLQGLPEEEFNQIEKEMMRVSQMYEDGIDDGEIQRISIVRVELKGFMGFCVDFIALAFASQKCIILSQQKVQDKENEGESEGECECEGNAVEGKQNPKKGAIEIQYEGNEILCDSYFQRNSKKLMRNNIPAIERVYLSKNATIKRCLKTQLLREAQNNKKQISWSMGKICL